MSSNYTIAHQLVIEGRADIFDFRKYESYHKLVFYPSWFQEQYASFVNQVYDMSKKKKPFKCSDTFKIQAGYPHEVEIVQKDRLIENGVKRDYLSAKRKTTIPKLDIHNFMKISSTSENPLAFTTPKDSNFIRDITVVDCESHKSLAFVYIVNRKAQVICCWSEPKFRGKYKMELPKNVIKKHTYKTE
jgi:hypothetical protein